jgi:hypothetical protein
VRDCLVRPPLPTSLQTPRPFAIPLFDFFHRTDIGQIITEMSLPRLAIKQNVWRAIIKAAMLVDLFELIYHAARLLILLMLFYCISKLKYPGPLVFDRL